MLTIPEAEATKIVLREYKRRGTEEGLQNFARTVLAAHSEQAKDLAHLAVLLGTEQAIDAHYQPQNPLGTTEVLGDQLKLTHTSTEPVSLARVADLYGVDLNVWEPDYQTLAVREGTASDSHRIFAKFKYSPTKALILNDREHFREWASKFSPEPDPLEYEFPDGSKNLLELVIPDLHVGKYIEDKYNYLEALDRLEEGARSILRRSLIDGIERVDLVFLGDTFNDDNARRTTTRGTPQQSAGRRESIFRAVRERIASLAYTCVKAGAQVHIWVLRGNHDNETAFYLADSLWAYFANDARVVVHADPKPREYISWGTCLLGLTHMDGAKDKDLVMNLLRENDTSGKRWMEVHGGHLHHEHAKEIHGVTVRGFGSPADNRDDYHDLHGFGTARQSMTGVVWNKDKGKTAEYYVCFGDESWTKPE